MLNVTVDYDETVEKVKDARALLQLMAVADQNGLSEDAVWRAALVAEKMLCDVEASFDSAYKDARKEMGAEVA